MLINLTAQTTAIKTWPKHKAVKWFKQKKWLNGLWLAPDETINQREFARQYHINQAYWDQAFAFMKENDLSMLVKGKYRIDGDNVFAVVTEDPFRDFDKTQWESHRKYVDIQCVIKGEEKIGVCPISKATVIKEYDEKKDVINYTADGKYHYARPGTFFVFFPSDAHRPNIASGANQLVKKIVIKVKAVE